MADAKISALTAIAGSALADNDKFVVVDDSVTTTKHVLESTLGATPALVAAFLGLTQAHNAQTGTTYTLVLTDANKLVTLTNASAIAMTVPPNASVAFPTGTQIDLAQRGAGAVTVTAGAGVTINTHANDTLVMNGQYAYAVLSKIGTNEWDLFGNLVAA